MGMFGQKEPAKKPTRKERIARGNEIIANQNFNKEGVMSGRKAMKMKRDIERGGK